MSKLASLQAEHPELSALFASAVAAEQEARVQIVASEAASFAALDSLDEALRTARKANVTAQEKAMVDKLERQSSEALSLHGAGHSAALYRRSLHSYFSELFSLPGPGRKLFLSFVFPAAVMNAINALPKKLDPYKTAWRDYGKPVAMLQAEERQRRRLSDRRPMAAPIPDLPPELTAAR